MELSANPYNGIAHSKVSRFRGIFKGDQLGIVALSLAAAELPDVHQHDSGRADN
jgi:hypothetical protein